MKNIHCTQYKTSLSFFLTSNLGSGDLFFGSMVHTGIHIRHTGQLRGQLVNFGLGNRHQHHERKVTSQLGRLRFSNIATSIGHIFGHVRDNSKSIATDGIDNQLFWRKETSLNETRSKTGSVTSIEKCLVIGLKIVNLRRIRNLEVTNMEFVPRHGWEPTSLFWLDRGCFYFQIKAETPWGRLGYAYNYY